MKYETKSILLIITSIVGKHELVCDMKKYKKKVKHHWYMKTEP